MALVFYGHFVELVYKAGSGLAFHQFRFIYSFHMPLFFFMSGFFWKNRSNTLSEEGKRLFFRRLVPVFFFGVLLLPLWLASCWFSYRAGDFDRVIWRIQSYARGNPEPDYLTWFLVCLFTTELIACMLLPILRRRLTISIVAAVFLGAGLLLCDHMEFAEQVFGFRKNTWYIHESLVAFGFYALGYVLFPILSRCRQWHILVRMFLAAFLLFITFPISSLNNPEKGFVVLMAMSNHGESIPFVVSALTGIAGVLMLSGLIPSNRPTRFIGKHTVILLGLNGVFFHFVNRRFLSWYMPPDAVIPTTLYCVFITLLSFVVCIPFVMLIDRWFPRFVGRGKRDGAIGGGYGRLRS